MTFKKGYTPWNKRKKCPQLGVRLGIKHSEETKKKMSLAHKGKISWCKGIKLSKELCAKRKSIMIEYYKQGNKAGMFDKHHSKETKRKMSLAQKGREPGYIAYGKNNHFWIDGRSKIKGYKSLKAKRRKYRLKGGGELFLKTIQQVYEDNIKKYGTLTCYLCSNFIKFGNDSLEHKIPLIRGGTNARENLEVACKLCNSKKGIKTEIEYRNFISQGIMSGRGQQQRQA